MVPSKWENNTGLKNATIWIGLQVDEIFSVNI